MGSEIRITPFGVDRTPTRAAIVAAALDILDEKGFEGLSLRRLTGRLNADAAALRYHFARRGKLFEAMAGRMMRDAAVPADASACWRESLRRRAITARRAMLSRRDGALVMARGTPPSGRYDRACLDALAAGGFDSDAAEGLLETVDRFTLGWTMREQIGREKPDGSEGRFAGQLEALLRALGPSAPRREPRHAAMLPLHIGAVLRAAQTTAGITEAAAPAIADLDRRILLLLAAEGALVSTALSASMAIDKAQISRAVSQLTEAGLIARASGRAPLRLSPPGSELAHHIAQGAIAHDRALSFGLSPERRADYFATIERLTTRAIRLFREERQAARRADGADDAPDTPVYPRDSAMVVDRSRVLPPLVSLHAYMARSAALAFKRTIGLSGFETTVLGEIAGRGPLDWPTLVQRIDRDRSQAARTLRRLLEMGLIERTGDPAKRFGVYTATAQGLRCDALAGQTIRQHAAFLAQALSPRQLDDFRATLDLVAHNAAASAG